MSGGPSARVLVVRLSSIGDVVHALPVAAALQEAGYGVEWLVEPPARPLVDPNPAVARVHVAPPARAFRPSAARETLRGLRRDPCDVAVDLQGLWKSAAWARLSGARRLVGRAAPERKEALSAILLSEVVPVPPAARHVVDLNLAVLRAVGLDVLGLRSFPLPRPAAERTSVELRLAERGLVDFAVLNPGGGWASKLWPAERFARTAAGLRDRGLRALVTWGPGEEPLADRIVAASGGAAERCFETSLLELAELVRRARLVVAADTGPLHLACAVGTPVVALFGPTDPARNGPFSPADEVVRHTPPCAPCHRRVCPRHEGVMARIEPMEVLAAVERRLARAS